MTIRILTGDCRAVLATLPAETFQTCVTSPPYFSLRDYGHDRQIGREASPDEFVSAMVDVFRGVRRVLRPDGTIWLNLGDSYGKDKALLGIPRRVAFALGEDGWLLRSAIVWNKPNPLPESVKNRPTGAYEMVFLFAASERYFYDADAIREPSSYDGPPKPGKKAQTADTGLAVHSGRLGVGNPDGRNARNVWTIAPTEATAGAHIAPMPPDLAERCIKAGSRPGDAVLDPFGGAGTTGLVADRLGRDATLIELNPEYVRLAEGRIRGDAPLLVDVGT